MKHLLALGIGLLLTAQPVRANTRAPIETVPPKPQGPQVVIEVDEKATTNRLIVPMNLLQGAQPQLQPGGGQPPRRGAFNMSTVMVGVALSLSLAFGGLWLVRRRGGGKALLPMILAIVCMGVGGAALYADIAPRPGQRPFVPPPEFNKNVTQVLGYVDGVKVELVPRDTTIRLIVTPAVKKTLAEATAPKK